MTKNAEQPKEAETLTPGEINALIESASQTMRLPEMRHRFVGMQLSALVLVAIQQRAELAAIKAQAEAPNGWANIPPDMVRLVCSLGPVGWGATLPLTPTEAGAMLANSVRLTSEHFGQDYQQPMNVLTLRGTDTVLAYTGTGPASGTLSSALAGAWNLLVSHCQTALAEAGEGQ